MEDSELARLEHANMVEAFLLLAANPPDAVTRRADGVVLISSGVPFILFNQAMIEDEEATPAALAAAVGVLRERGLGFVVNLRVGADDRFVAALGDLGLVGISRDPWMPGMALFPIPTEPLVADPPGHEIRRVTTQAGLDDHIRAAAVGFEMPVELLEPVMVPSLFEREGAGVYVGYVDGEAVSTGLGLRTGRTIGVYNISTVPSARGRGYGAAMTRRIAADGAAAGCDVAILQASDMGYPIYQRLGYRTVVEYMGYVERSPDAS